ncbi:TEX10 protein, partial [Atractosteus spatula]|nr:TEX10 protein [Atractosteus spatula]
MTKKRKRQDDFQKVKLKVGKKKPKPDNVTNVSFKTKGIRLPEQLKSSESGPTTHRQLSIKDLLSQLHHYSGGVKQGALAGLRELLAKNPSLLDAHLSSVLSEAAAVFTDKEPGVRAAAVRLLRFLAPRVPAERVAPFFPLLGAHLSCAMTHIAEGIQEDALQALDVLLEHYPALLAARSAVLLKNFLELISQQRLWRRGRGGEERKTAPWALSVSPGRRVTSQQWRLSVLTRLGRFLQAVVEERPAEEGAGSRDVLDVGEREGGCGKITPVELTWEEHSFGKGGVQVYENAGARASVCSAFRLRPDTEPGAGLEEGLTSVETVKGFASTLVPLLLEVWVEASTSEQGSSENAHLLHPEAMSLMYQVLNILQLLRCLAPQRHDQAELDAWFRSTYLSDFRQHFMKNFPYAQVEVAKHKKKGESKRIKQAAAAGDAGVDPLALNLTLCQVMANLTSSADGRQDADWLGPVRAFVRESLTSGVRLGARHLANLLEVVWKLVLTQRNKGVTEELLQAVSAQYQQRNLTLPVRVLLLRFFSRLYLQEHEVSPQVSRSKVLSRWLAALPLQLAQLGFRNPHLSAQLLRTVQAAAARRNRELLHSLQTHACRLYDPEEGSVVLLPQDSQHRLVQLVYFLPSLPPDLLSCLSRCCTAGRVSASLAASLIRIVHMRSSLSGWTLGVQEAALSDVDYFSFLFSTLAGFSAEELSVLQGGSEEDMCGSSPLSPLSLYHTELEHFMHHWDVVEEVCHCLETVGSRSQCFDILQNAICKNLARLQVVPDSTAAALLRSVSRLLGPSLLPSEELLRFLASCCLSLLTLLLSLDHEPPAQDSSQKREAVWGACVGALGGVPRLLRLVLQAVQVSELGEEELPLVAQLLRLLLQHSQLRNHMLANATLLQHLVQDLTRCCRGAAREQWLTDLLYCYSVALSAQHRGAAGPRDAY